MTLGFSIAIIAFSVGAVVLLLTSLLILASQRA
jgi:hypothetical protein